MVTMRPQPGLDHVGHGGLEAVEGPGQVDRHHALPVLGADVEEVLEALDAGTGHHDLDPAQVKRRTSVQRSLDRRSVADVDGARPTAVKPSASSSLATSSAASALTSRTATLRPWRARWRQMARAHARATTGHHCGAAHLRPTRLHCRPPTRAAAKASGSAAGAAPPTNLSGRCAPTHITAHPPGLPAPRGAGRVGDVTDSAQSCQLSLAFSDSSIYR